MIMTISDVELWRSLRSAGKENNIIILIRSNLQGIFLSASCRGRELIHYNNTSDSRKRMIAENLKHFSFIQSDLKPHA